MQEIYVEDVRKVLQNKKRLEKELGIKITNRGKNIFVNGSAEAEYTSIQVMEAINLGFSLEKALLLTKEDIILQTLNIKDITKRKNFHEIRARLIGTRGKTLGTLANLTKCEVSLHDNKIGIIGDAEEIEDAVQAITSIIVGSKQGNVYARLERQKKQRRLQGKLEF